MLFGQSPNRLAITNMIDASRQYDLEYLNDLYRNAPSETKREELERIIVKIMRESGAVRERREELLEAVRKHDRRRVRYVQEELRSIERKEKGGLESIKV